MRAITVSALTRRAVGVTIMMLLSRSLQFAARDVLTDVISERARIFRSFRDFFDSRGNGIAVGL